MRTIMLLDLDCFFASVEMALHPELRDVPLCVGGLRGERGIVTCPNYEARKYGVRTAMPVRTAERLLPPEAQFVHGHHRLYGEYSDRVMEILESFTPDVEQVSIDEAYMDVTGCLHFWGGDPARMANAMKERIRSECGLTVSIGVARARMCAKIAAGARKPDGLVVVPPGGEEEFLAPLPVDVIPGIGPKTLDVMLARGIATVGDLLRQARAGRSHIGQHVLERMIGAGEEVRRDRHEHSMSRDTTFNEDTNDGGRILSTLYYLAERCCKALRADDQCAGTVTVKVRFANFHTVQKQATLDAPTANEEDVFRSARRLLGLVLPPGRMVRLVGVKVSHLVPAGDATGELEFGRRSSERLRHLHRKLDALQEKHGYQSIQWGITYALRDVCEPSDEGYRLHSPVYELI
jgi:DNA polymerase-4